MSRKMKRHTAFLLILSAAGCLLAQSVKPNIAVMELDGNGVSATELAGLSNRLRMELFNTGTYTVIERSRMDEILKEQGFQQTGCTNTQCAVEVGQLIGVQKIVIGSIDKVAETYSVNVRMVDVASGRIDANVADDCDGCKLVDVLKTTIRNAAIKLAGSKTEAVATATQAVSGPQQQSAGSPSDKTAISADKVSTGMISRVRFGYYEKDGIQFKGIHGGWHTMLEKVHGCPEAEATVLTYRNLRVAGPTLFITGMILAGVVAPILGEGGQGYGNAFKTPVSTTLWSVGMACNVSALIVLIARGSTPDNAVALYNNCVKRGAVKP
jgi:hypothetical protein